MLLILVVLVSAGSGVYAGASFFAQQGANVTVTTTIYTTTTSWTASTIWSTVTQTVEGVLTTIEYTTSTSTATVTGGTTTAYTGGSGNSGEPSAAYVYAFPITLPAGGTVQSIGVNWAGGQSGNVRVALYSAGSGKPANLLTQSASIAMTEAAGWQDIPVTAYTVTVAGTYWVAVQLSSSKGVYYQPGSRSFYTRTYGAFDSGWSPSSGQDSAAQWNMRVTYLGTL
jgi:hypothetical protein